MMSLHNDLFCVFDQRSSRNVVESVASFSRHRPSVVFCHPCRRIPGGVQHKISLGRRLMTILTIVSPISLPTAYDFVNNKRLFSLLSNDWMSNFVRPADSDNPSKTIISKLWILFSSCFVSAQLSETYISSNRTLLLKSLHFIFKEKLVLLRMFLNLSKEPPAYVIVWPFHDRGSYRCSIDSQDI